MMAISLRFQGVYGEDLGKFLTTCRFIVKQLDYSLSIPLRET